jgi:hypothetical protein
LTLSKLIVVTTLTDTADFPFNEDSLCGTGTVGNLPGADGLISLREAIIAANNMESIPNRGQKVCENIPSTTVVWKTR